VPAAIIFKFCAKNAETAKKKHKQTLMVPGGRVFRETPKKKAKSGFQDFFFGIWPNPTPSFGPVP